MSTPKTPTASKSAGVYQYGPDFSYFVKVLVGSAQQPFYMLLDTGASNTWLMGSHCTSDACKMHSTFDPSTSKTWQTNNNEFLIRYGTGNLTGHVGHDKASLAGMDFDLLFGLANYTADDFKHYAFDGILGLGMGSTATGNFIEMLRASKLLDSLVFGLSLNRDSDGTNDGQITFGGVDKAKYTGDISYNNIPSPQKEDGVWAIPLEGLSVNGKKADVKPTLGYMDAGTSFIFAPPNELAALLKLVPGAKAYDSNGYMAYDVPCDTQVAISVTFAGVTYNIPPQDWVGRTNDTNCVSRLYGYGVNNNTWLFGDAFLKNVYTVFDADKRRIGFAAKPPPPPKPTTTTTSGAGGAAAAGGSGGSATTLAPASLTSLAGQDSSHPIMPGFSSQETSGPGNAQTATGPATAHTTVSWGTRLGASSPYLFAPCIVAAAVAVLG